MRSKLLSVAGFAVAATIANLVAPSHASAAPRAPVAVNSCSPVFTAVGGNVDNVPAMVQYGVQITYVNTSTITAHSIAFNIGDASAATTVVDHGTFAPGARIRHIFTTNTDPESGCRVSAMQFADGTAYNASEILSAAR